MWCETVGWVSPTGSVRSQMHASPDSLAAINETSLTRVGSPSALNIRASRSACPSSNAPPVSGVQHAARSAIKGSVTAGMGSVCHTH